MTYEIDERTLEALEALLSCVYCDLRLSCIMEMDGDEYDKHAHLLPDELDDVLRQSTETEDNPMFGHIFADCVRLDQFLSSTTGAEVERCRSVNWLQYKWVPGAKLTLEQLKVHEFTCPYCEGSQTKQSNLFGW